MADERRSRPARGLPPEEALERWSAPGAYAAMRDYWDARVEVSVAAGVEPPPKVLRHQEYKRRREPIEKALLEKLRSGKLAASAMHRRPDPQAPRFVLHPEIFREMRIDYAFEEIVGAGTSLNHPEIFVPAAIPLNIPKIPGWYQEIFGIGAGMEIAPETPQTAASRRAFSHSTDYRIVTLGGVRFSLTTPQALIVHHLHRAHEDGSPAVHKRELLTVASSASEKIAAIFRRHKEPHWSVLIGSDGKGMYWLRIDG